MRRDELFALVEIGVLTIWQFWLKGTTQIPYPPHIVQNQGKARVEAVSRV